MIPDEAAEEDITGVDSQGFLIVTGNCSCDYTEAREAIKVDGRVTLALRKLVSRRDYSCPIHKLS